MTTLTELRARLDAPSTSTAFVGREAAVAALRAVLDLVPKDAPLLTQEEQALLLDGWTTCHHTAVTAVAQVLATVRTSTRRASNTNDRGNAAQRRVRKRWLVATYGDGSTVRCYRCSTELTVDTVTSDRIVPGAEGGTYRRDNIRPACGPCNTSTGGALGAARRDGRPIGPDLPPVLARLLAEVRCHPTQVRVLGRDRAELVAQLAHRGLVVVEGGTLRMVVRPARTEVAA